MAEAQTDERIVTQVLTGERDRFEVLMRRHNQRIYRAVRAVLTDEAEVEDVMQQAYLNAFLHLGELAQGKKLVAWLVRIAVRLAIDRIRKRRQLAEDELGDVEREGDRMRSPEKALGDREVARILEEALDDLPEIYRVVFVLREVEGLSTQEVADALDISDSLVKVRLHRAKDRLRKELLDRAGRAVTDVFVFQAPRCDRVVSAVLESIRLLTTH